MTTSVPVSINAEIRTPGGKGAARAVRRSGFIPCIVYGGDKDPVSISIDPRSVAKSIHRSGFYSKILELTVDGKAEHVIPRDVQLDPVKDTPLHIDFQRVSAGSRLHVYVPVQFINEDKCPGIKSGGVLNVIVHEVELDCAASNIPEAIVIDLEGCDIGHPFHINDAKLPEGVKPLHSETVQTLATIVAPTIEVEEKPAEEAPAEGTEGTTAEGEAAADSEQEKAE